MSRNAPNPIGSAPNANNPLADLDEWEVDLKRRYPAPADEADEAVDEHKFRDYAAEARPSVREFYRLNHQHQTFGFVQQKRAQYLGLSTRRMSIWEALEFLNTLVDDSDPDIDLA